MTGIAILDMLFGAALVAIGVLAAATADRIRGIKFQRESAPRERASRALTAPTSAPAVIPVVESAELLAKPAVKRRAAPNAEPVTQTIADDVIAALVAAGYKKPVATEATWGCTAAERATVEQWTVAALSRCGKGGAA